MTGVTSTTIGGIAAAARTVLQDALPLASVYDYAPVQGFDTFPAIWFTPPSIERRSVDDAEQQLGAVDLTLRYTLHAYVLDNASGEGGRSAEDEAAQLIGTIIGTIDANPTLSGAVDVESIIESAEFQRADIAVANVSGGLAVVGYEAQFAVFTLV
jgi:hypothetical protein